MSLSVQETYLGWRELAHAADCARPLWMVDVREDEGYRASYSGDGTRHACTGEDCDHGSSFPRMTVRVVCPSCHMAHVIRGESHSNHRTTTKATGIGEAPRKVVGLFLWPGEPWFNNEPHQWLATRHKPGRIQPKDVVGEIHEDRGPRGGKQYAALALPTPDGPYGVGRLRWQRMQEGFRSFAAAAKWLAAQHYEDGGEA